jgi:hypothetical protein
MADAEASAAFDESLTGRFAVAAVSGAVFGSPLVSLTWPPPNQGSNIPDLIFPGLRSVRRGHSMTRSDTVVPGAGIAAAV